MDTIVQEELKQLVLLDCGLLQELPRLRLVRLHFVGTASTAQMEVALGVAQGYG